MRARIGIAILTLSILNLGCIEAQSALHDKDTEVQIALLRYQLKEKSGLIFLARLQAGKIEDPPPILLQASNMSHIRIKSYSDCKIVDRSEMEFAVDREDGMSGEIVYVGQPHWSSDETARITIGGFTVSESNWSAIFEVNRASWLEYARTMIETRSLTGRWIVELVPGTWKTLGYAPGSGRYFGAHAGGPR